MVATMPPIDQSMSHRSQLMLYSRDRWRMLLSLVTDVTLIDQLGHGCDHVDFDCEFVFE